MRLQLLLDVVTFAAFAVLIASGIPTGAPAAVYGVLLGAMWLGYVGYTAAAWWAFHIAHTGGKVREIDAPRVKGQSVYFIAIDCRMQSLVCHFIRTMR